MARFLRTFEIAFLKDFNHFNREMESGEKPANKWMWSGIMTYRPTATPYSGAPNANRMKVSWTSRRSKMRRRL